MYKAEMFLRKYKSEILDFIHTLYDADASEAEVTYLASICGNYNEIHKFVELCKRGKTHHGKHNHLSKFGMAAPEDHENVDEIDWLLHNIEDELGGAEKYFDKWVETKDAAYKALSREELKHADQLLKIAKTKEATSENVSLLQELSGAFQALLGRVS